MDVHKITCLPQTKEEFVKENNDDFNGLGRFPGKCSIRLKENAKHYSFEFNK